MHPEATRYLATGLCVLPAHREEKRPSLKRWKQYRKRLPTRSEVGAWFANGVDGLCILTGAISGNVEMIDFDVRAELFEPWRAKVEATAPGLLDRLFIETSQSEGRHVAYRCEAEICGNLKLAQRRQAVRDDEITIDEEGREWVTICGKKYAVREDADGKHVILTLIETRGEGGLFLCAPTAGYEAVQGDLCNLPVLTEAERDALLRCAWELNEHVPDVVDGPRQSPNKSHSPATVPNNGDRPGDDFNNRGDVRAVLEQHGWVCTKGGENEYWRRPGKTSGTSATLRGGVFYVFSSNAAPFEPNQAYSPFAVFTMLEHGGDFEQAARSLRHVGYGDDSLAHNATDVDISALLGPCGAQDDDCAPQCADPGPLPEDLLRIPGFVSEVMDHCLMTAPYPNTVMAFCGALALQSFLAGRKVRDPGDNRTNVYLLGLADSGVGKNRPREINVRVIHQVGLMDGLGQSFASGEGIQDALFVTPCMLFQTDEIDGMLQSMTKSRDARHEAAMGTLLTMYSSANSVFPMRRKAGKESPGVIDQPSLTIFGTAIPIHYYRALNERMLTNGFLARMLIFEAGERGNGQDPAIADPPPRILATAKWWADYAPGQRGNLKEWHPVPAVVEHSDAARRVLSEARDALDHEYREAQKQGDAAVTTTVLARVDENTRKLALLYAISENHEAPRISKAAAEWATRVAMHQARRMLFMVSEHVANGEFSEALKKAVNILRDHHAKKGRNELMPEWYFKRRMDVPPGVFKDIKQELADRRIAVCATEPGKTKPKSGFRLI